MSRPSAAKTLRRRRRIARRPPAQEYARLAYQGRLRDRGAAKVHAVAANAAGEATWTT